MTRPTNARAYLSQIRELKADIRFCRREADRLRDLTQSITAKWREAPGGGGDLHKDSALAALADMTAKLDEKTMEYVSLVQEITSFIDEIEKMEYRCVLRLRYVDCMRWPKVMEEMEELGLYYSDRSVYYIHGRALQEADRIWRLKEHEDR